MAAKDARVIVRMPAATKKAFEKAAERDDTNVSAWLRALGEQRITEQQPGPPAQTSFLPGFGITNHEED